MHSQYSEMMTGETNTLTSPQIINVYNLLLSNLTSFAVDYNTAKRQISKPRFRAKKVLKKVWKLLIFIIDYSIEKLFNLIYFFQSVKCQK